MTDQKSDSASRWDAAAKLAAGVIDDGFHKRRARVLLQLIILVVSGWIIGFIVALIFLPKAGSGHGNSATSTVPQLIAEVVFLALGFVIGIAGFIWARRTAHYITRWRAVASPLNRSEKKSVRHQISGKNMVDREHLTVVVAIAKQSRRATLGVAPLYVASMLFAVAIAIGSNFLLLKLLELAVALLFVIAVVQVAVFYRRAGRFIDQYSEPELSPTQTSPERP